MSFILDALKKSEQERQKNHVPDLKTSHDGVPRNGWTRHLRFWFLLLALFLNAGLILYWLWPSHMQPQAEAQITEEISPASQSPAPLSPAASEEAPIVAAPPAVPPPPPRVEAASPRPVSSTAHQPVTPAAQVSSKIPDMASLSPEARRRLPEIEISLHFYSSTPALSMVRINGINLREGDRVAPGLRLEQITPTGVVLDHEGTRFRAGNF